MTWIGAFVSLVLIIGVFVDAFEVMVLPRRVRHRYRLVRILYRSMWAAWQSMAQLLPVGKWRNGFFSVFGPISLFGLISVWAIGLIFGFAMLHWSLGTE